MYANFLFVYMPKTARYANLPAYRNKVSNLMRAVKGFHPKIEKRVFYLYYPAGSRYRPPGNETLVSEGTRP